MLSEKELEEDFEENLSDFREKYPKKKIHIENYGFLNMDIYRRDIASIVEKNNVLCYYCGERVFGKEWTITFHNQTLKNEDPIEIRFFCIKDNRICRDSWKQDLEKQGRIKCEACGTTVDKQNKGELLLLSPDNGKSANLRLCKKCMNKFLAKYFEFTDKL